MSTTAVPETLTQRLKSRLLGLALLLGLMWLLLLVPDAWNQRLAIRAQARDGWWGIPLAPLLHADLAHLASNTLPLAVLGALIALRSWREFVSVSLLVTLGSGLGAWYFGRVGEVHLGASGLIFGYFGFLLARGLLERTLASLVIALAVGFYYGGLLWQVFPKDTRISWQAHLFGLLSGLVSAWLVARNRRYRP
jgi:membrane associated rhomboid family serine protease